MTERKSGETIDLYEYDRYNQLIKANVNGIEWEYGYTADGLRGYKSYGEVLTFESEDQPLTIDCGKKTTSFIYDNGNIISEAHFSHVFEDEDTTLDGVNTYYRGYEIIKTNDDLYYIYNGQGDVTYLTNETGEIVADYSYDAYGNLEERNLTYNPFGYRGEYIDEETGLIYLRNRYYDPSIGRFISEDPIRSGTNWYVYANNNPVKYVDPLGLESVIFVANGMEAQAEIRQEFYTERYGTDSYKIIISSPKEFVDKWNQWFALCDKLNVEIDAIEIISHGSIEGKVGKDSYGTAYSTGYIYFDDKDDRLYARNIKGISNKDRSLEKLISVNAKEMNISSCNGANKDTYNVLYGFMQRVKAEKYSGFDGGAQWDSNLGDHIDGGGDYDADRPWYMGGPWYYVKRYQHTWWKYVDKQNGVPVREREGRRYFE